LWFGTNLVVVGGLPNKTSHNYQMSGQGSFAQNVFLDLKMELKQKTLWYTLDKPKHWVKKMSFKM